MIHCHNNHNARIATTDLLNQKSKPIVMSEKPVAENVLGMFLMNREIYFDSSGNEINPMAFYQLHRTDSGKYIITTQGSVVTKSAQAN